MPDAPRQLHYAQRPSPHRRRIRRAVIVALIVVAVIASLKWAEPAWDHARLLYYQGRCSRGWTSGGQLIFDGKTPSTCLDYENWDQFYALLSPPGKKPSVTTFMHELRRKDGTRRLVAVEMASWTTNAFKGKSPLLILDTTVVVPGEIWSRPKVRASSPWSTWLAPENGVPDDSLQLYGGVADSDDPTHFTIAFTYAQRRRTIDGWLKGDDSVLLELREPPTGTAK